MGSFDFNYSPITIKLKMFISLCIFTAVGFQSCSCGLALNSTGIFGYPVPIWDESFLKLDLMIKYSQTLCIVDGTDLNFDGYVAKDYYERLVTFINDQKVIGLNLFKPISMPVCRNRRCTRVKIKSKQMKRKRIIILVYETLRKFTEALFVDKWSFFRHSSTSFYAVIMMDESFIDVPCNGTAIVGLRKKLGDTFARIWKMYQIGDIFIIMPKFCNAFRVMKFDPLRTCKENDCSKMIAIIENFNNSRKSALFHKKSNFKKYPLRVSYFNRLPTLLTNVRNSLSRSFLMKDTKDVQNIAGVDGFIFGNMVKYLNFTPIMLKWEKQDYGYMLPNGTYIGSVADILNRQSDISINGRFMKPYESDDIMFTYPLYSDEFCLVAPKSRRIPIWLSIFQVFHVTTWTLLLATACFMSILWYLIRCKYSPMAEKSDFSRMFMDVSLLIVSRPMKMPFLHGERIFIFICFFFNLMFSALFQGYLTTAYSTTAYYKDIDTLQEVDATGFHILVSPSIGDIFTSGVSPLMDRLRSRVTSESTSAAAFNDLVNVRMKNKIFYAERKGDAKLLMTLKFTKNTHIVEECPRYFYLCYIVHRSYPFTSHINRFILSLNSAGLIKKWYDFTEYTILLHQRIHKKDLDVNIEKLSMLDLQTAFFLLIFGLAISFLMFVVEVVLFRYNVRKVSIRKELSTT